MGIIDVMIFISLEMIYLSIQYQSWSSSSKSIEKNHNSNGKSQREVIKELIKSDQHNGCLINIAKPMKMAGKKQGKKKEPSWILFSSSMNYALCFASLETVNFCLPLARLEAKTRRPLAELILSRKPCLLRRFLFDG